MRGGELLLEELINIFPAADIYTLFYRPERISLEINLRPIYTSLLQKIPPTKQYYRYFLPFFPFAIERMDLADYNLIFSISHCVAKGVKKRPNQIHICYCNSPMRYLYDQFDVYFRNSQGKLKLTGVVLNLIRDKLKKWDFKSSKKERVDLFIANSRNIADKIKKYWNRDSEIIYPFVDVNLFAPQKEQGRNNFPAKYFLIVSALVPYKRIDIAIQAFNILKERLIIVGEGTERGRLEKMANSNIEFGGWVSDESLRELYQGCQALIFPGEEDFGIVPLEAMACGKPVIAFRKGGALETVIDGVTGRFFNDPHPESLAETVKCFHPEDFNFLDLRRRAEEFSRDVFHKSLVNILKKYFPL